MVDVRAAKAYWDRAGSKHPGRYSVSSSSVIDEHFFLGGERDLNHLFDEFAVAVGRDSTVLDLGCGAGRMTRPLAARSGKVIAADISSSMIEAARAVVDPDNVEFLQLAGDGTIDLPDDSVDLVFSAATLTHVRDRDVIRKYLEESIRVVRPWGKVVIQLRRRSRRAEMLELLADLRNRLRGLRSLSRFWRGTPVTVESLLPLRKGVGLLSVLNLDHRYLWVVLDFYGGKS